MTLREFQSAVHEGKLSHTDIEEKWKKFCEQLSVLDTEDIIDLVFADALLIFVDGESTNMFGTEGMWL